MTRRSAVSSSAIRALKFLGVYMYEAELGPEAGEPSFGVNRRRAYRKNACVIKCLRVHLHPNPAANLVGEKREEYPFV